MTAHFERTSSGGERCEFPYGEHDGQLPRCPRSGVMLADHPNPLIGSLLVCVPHASELAEMRARW